jgi:hypothetical protein
MTTTREKYESAVRNLKSQAALVDGGKAAMTSLTPMFVELATSRAACEDEQIAKLAEVGSNSSVFAELNTASASTTGIDGVGFTKSVFDAGFSLKSKPSVEMQAMTALGMKANVFPASSTWSPRPLSGIVGVGRDQRWLFPLLNPIDVGHDTSVQDFKQSAVVLTGSPDRAVDAITTKADLAMTLTLVTEAIRQQAVTISNIPNALLESVQLLGAFLQSEGQAEVHKAMDANVYAQITAAGIPFGVSGADLISKVRNAIGAMRALGASPSILVLNATDSAALDLSQDSGGYIFPSTTSGSSSPLWGLRVVERAGNGVEPPLLLDPGALGQLYMGTMRVDADVFSGFKKNTTDLRVEVNSLYHVRQPSGAMRIAAT